MKTLKKWGIQIYRDAGPAAEAAHFEEKLFRHVPTKLNHPLFAGPYIPFKNMNLPREFFSKNEL